jgi:hypothetical protein
MKHFTDRQVEEAWAHAEAGGQALHTHAIICDRAKAPRCFVRAVDRGEKIAHLFDMDEARLVATARRLGVNVVVVERPGRKGMHVDLCGAPLRKALAECEQGSLIE